MNQGRLTETEAAEILRKLLSAVHHLNTMDISHRDLKPDNFIYSHTGESAEIKLVDFGMSVQRPDELMKTMVGTPYYLAP